MYRHNICKHMILFHLNKTSPTKNCISSLVPSRSCVSLFPPDHAHASLSSFPRSCSRISSLVPSRSCSRISFLAPNSRISFLAPPTRIGHESASQEPFSPLPSLHVPLFAVSRLRDQLQQLRRRHGHVRARVSLATLFTLARVCVQSQSHIL